MLLSTATVGLLLEGSTIPPEDSKKALRSVEGLWENWTPLV